MAKKIKGIIVPAADIERELGETGALVKEVVRIGKIINQRFYRLEKAGIAKQSYAYQVAQGETGRDKPRYMTNLDKLRKMDRLDLYRMYRQMYAKYFSDTSKEAKLKKIVEEKLEESYQAAQYIARSAGLDIEINKDDYIKFLELMGSEYLNSTYLYSEQLIEDFIMYTQIGNLSVKEFAREYKRFKNIENLDTIRVRRNLDRALERKRIRERKKAKQTKRRRSKK